MSWLCSPLAAAFAAVQPDWMPAVSRWRTSSAGRNLERFVEARLAEGAVIYPARPLRALEVTSLRDAKVVILGQDPYHGPGQAEGLAFSVPPGVVPPPSLRNIFRELARDLSLARPSGGHLGPWAARGVLLLNATLTVEAGCPGAHAGRGWEVLTDALIDAIAAKSQPVVFLLWGAHAQAKATRIEAIGAGRHLVLRCSHPSPLSATRPPAPFIGSGHFGAASRFVRKHYGQPLDWTLS